MTKKGYDIQYSSVGSEARKLRMSLCLTQQELAHTTGVSLKDIRLFEQGLPLPVSCKINVLRELWSRTVNLKPT